MRTRGVATTEVLLLLVTVIALALGAYLVAGFLATPQVTGVFPVPAAETVTLRGAHFSPEPGANLVLFGDKTARVLRASPTALDVEVPEFGLSPGGRMSVPVRVLVGERASVARDVLVAAPAEKAAVPSPSPEPAVATAPSPSPLTSPPAAAPPSPVAQEAKNIKPTPTPAPAGPDLGTLLGEADGALAGRKFEAAIQLYDEILKKEPDNEKARAGRASAQAATQSLLKTFTSGKTVEQGREMRANSKDFDFREVSVKKPPEVPGRIEFEVNPLRLAAGDAYTVRVFLQNEGGKSIKVSSLRVSSALNGARSDTPFPPRKAELAAKERALLYEETGVWREGVTSWTLEVLVGSGRGDTYRNQVLWK